MQCSVSRLRHLVPISAINFIYCEYVDCVYQLTFSSVLFIFIVFGSILTFFSSCCGAKIQQRQNICLAVSHSQNRHMSVLALSIFFERVPQRAVADKPMGRFNFDLPNLNRLLLLLSKGFALIFVTTSTVVSFQMNSDFLGFHC